MNSALPVHCGYITDPHPPSPATFWLHHRRCGASGRGRPELLMTLFHPERGKRVQEGSEVRASHAYGNRPGETTQTSPLLPPNFFFFKHKADWLVLVCQSFSSLRSPTTCCETRHWHCGIEIQSSPVCLCDIFGRTVPLNGSKASQFVRYFLEGQWFVFQTRPVKTNPVQDRFYDHFCRYAGVRE